MNRSHLFKLQRSLRFGLALMALGVFIGFASGAGRADQRIQLLAADANSVTFEIRIDAFQTQEVIGDGVRYQRLSLPQTATTSAIGEPELPALGQFIAVPPNSRITYDIIEEEHLLLPGYRVFPSQKPLVDRTGAMPQEFRVLPAAYARDAYYPSEPVQISELQTIRDLTVVHLVVHPLQYRAARNELLFHRRMQIRLQFHSQTRIEGYYHPEKLETDETFQAIYNDMVLNYETARQFPISATESLATEAVQGAELLIITPTAFRDAADKLAESKTRRGVSTLVRSTATTGSTAASIKTYIRNAYNTWSPRPSYVLLFGDANSIPVHYVTTHPAAGDDYPAGFKTGTDLYYSTMGGATDRLPDIHMGRIPVDTLTEANHVVDKIIYYETSPTSDADFYTTIPMAAYFQDRYDNDTGNPPPDKKEDRLFTRTSEDIRDYLLTQGYTLPRIYNTEAAKDPRWYNDGTSIPGALRKPGFPWNGSAADITSAVNNGAFLLFFRGHGSTTGWGEPNYYIDDISDWTNNDKTPVVFSTTCETGWFDAETDSSAATTRDPGFAEQLLRFGSHGRHGAVGVYAATRISFSWHNDALIKGFVDSIWPGFLTYSGTSPSSSRRTGSILSYGKYYYASVYGTTDADAITTLELYHYFGDPTMRIWTHSPSTLTVKHAATASLGATSFSVNVGQPSAQITISQNGVIIGSDSTWVLSGEVENVLLNPPLGPDEAYVAVTKENYRPYVRRIIIQPSAPTNLSSDARSKTQIWLDWKDNSSSEQGFRIERSPNGTGGWTQVGTTNANDTTFTNSGLVCGNDYYYRVLAYNEAGESPFTKPLGVSTIDCASTAPTNLKLSNITQTAMTLTWADTSDNESGFRIERSVDNNNWAQIDSVGPNVTTFVNSNLSCNTLYYYRVRSYNAGGTSAYSNTASSRTLDCTPSAPSGLTAQGISKTQIELNWRDNSNNETGFEIYSNIGSSPNQPWSKLDTVAANTTSFVAGVKTCNTSVQYRVRAINAGGNSDFSNIATGTTTPCIPAAPDRLEVRPVSKSEIFLRWIDNSTNETGFKIESDTGRGWATVVTTRPNDTDYSHTGLQCNTTYTYRVSACNAEGCSAPTNSARATTFDCTLGAPTNLTAVTVSTNQINLTWADNASGETGYKIERSLDGTSEWVPAGSTGANAVTFSDTGLQQNTLYYYRVYAYQTTLNSPYSNIAKAKTTESTQVLLEFAQIAVGGTWRSFLFLTNPTDAPIKSKVEFFQDNGQPLVVDINGRTSSSLDIMVVPDASLKLDLLGTTRTVQVGWCRVTAEGNLGGMLIYQLMNGNNVDSQATVLPSLRLRKFRIPLTYLRERTDVGLAIANPMNRPTQIAMQYFSLDGSSSIAGAPFLLDSMNHVARFFGEFLQNLPDNAQGVVEVLSDGDVIAVGLAFIKNSVFTTIPVIPVP